MSSVEEMFEGTCLAGYFGIVGNYVGYSATFHYQSALQIDVSEDGRMKAWYGFIRSRLYDVNNISHS